MYIFSLLEHSIWTYISFLFSSLSLSRNLSKNSNFVRTRDTFIPIANDKCVVMLRAWQITPVFSVSFNFKDRSYFFPPSLLPMNHWIELRGRRLIRAVHYWKYRLFFRKKGKKKVSLSFEKRGLIITSCHVTPRGEGDSFVAIIWNKSNDANASSLGEEINRVYRQSYIAWLIARVPDFYYHLQPVQRLYYYIIWIIVLADKL